MREDTLAGRQPRRAHIPTLEEMAAAELDAARQARLRRVRAVYGWTVALLWLPVSALAGYLASGNSLLLLGAMLIATVLFRPITALIAIERKPRTDDDEDDDNVDFDVAAADYQYAGGEELPDGDYRDVEEL